MKHLLIAILLSTLPRLAPAREITVQLPGDAALDMVWIAPGMFVMGRPEPNPFRQRDEQRRLLGGDIGHLFHRTRILSSRSLRRTVPPAFRSACLTTTRRTAQEPDRSAPRP